MYGGQKDPEIILIRVSKGKYYNWHPQLKVWKSLEVSGMGQK